MMPNLDSFQYAMENTHLVLAPERRLETFGTSILNYYLVTEEMDSVNESLVREGQIVAEKPQIITPDHMARLVLEGFGEKGEAFVDALGDQLKRLAILKYGFNLKKSDVRHYQVREPLAVVVEKVKEQVTAKRDPLSVVLTGVDDAWEVSLLKFMLEMVIASGKSNIQDLRDLGFLE